MCVANKSGSDVSVPPSERYAMRPLSPRLLARLKTWDGTVVLPRPAATVVLLRETSTGAREVFLMRRSATMAFAAGMFVFPGGAVQASDSDAGVPWIGPSDERMAGALGCDRALARALVVAAVRETFEETGVLLAGTGPQHVVSGTELAELGNARQALEAGDISLGEFLREFDLHLRADLLAPWAHWITPDFEPRRYDTRFFVAMIPPRQRVGILAAEAERGEWLELTAAHEAGRSGRFQMMAPTIHTLGRLERVGGDDVLAHAWGSPVRTIAPRLVEADGQYWLDTPVEEQL
jgi:8-oxo-dGTP pyrophosphatase MutT (NUDIX family)